MNLQPVPHRTLLLCSVLLIAGCVTINLYFPEQEVKDLAGQIEKQVQAEAAAADGTETPAPAARPDAPSGATSRSGSPGSVGLIGTLLGVTAAHAQPIPEPETTNPAIRKIIESRAARLADVNRYKATGVVGENNQGDLETRDLGALPDLRARAEVQKLVRAENADRETLYREIAAAKNIDPSQLTMIRATYAETLRANARAGDWIQTPDGTWKRKS